MVQPHKLHKPISSAKLHKPMVNRKNRTKITSQKNMKNNNFDMFDSEETSSQPEQKSKQNYSNNRYYQ